MGIIETLGYTAAITAADMMAKMAYIDIVKIERTGSGLLATIIEGDIDSVNIALEIGAEAAGATGELVAVHSIAKPLVDINLLKEDFHELQNHNESNGEFIDNILNDDEAKNEVQNNGENNKQARDESGTNSESDEKIRDEKPNKGNDIGQATYSIPSSTLNNESSSEEVPKVKSKRTRSKNK